MAAEGRHSLFRQLGNGIAGLAGLMLVALYPFSANATEIQEVTTPAGINAWLVEDHTVPIVAIDFAFQGGSAQDPEGKEGLVNLLSRSLDEGAGDLDSQAFQARMEDLVMQLSFDEGRDAFYGSMRTLTPNATDAFEMLRLAVTEPRFDDEAINRMKTQTISGLRQDLKDPDAIAARRWSELAFPGHPYGRPSKGTEETVSKLAPADLKMMHERLFARGNLKVAVVGDIDAATLIPLLDKVFGALPAAPDLTPVPEVEPKSGIVEAVAFNVPQTSIRFGLPALKRSDPDFIPAFVMNHILGGGSFSSWLYEEVREKRGLAYSVGSYLVPFDHAGLLMGATGTRAEKAGETLKIIDEQLTRMASDGPSEEELAKAKSYLTGSYALRFDTSGKIANQLVGLQLEGFGPDYIENRNATIEAVTLDQVKAVAKRILDGKKPTVVTVGPKGA
ncbi:insulinase family protein [Stappia sp. F7233]|uniref:Insulinase family protein n=2 Tax=Stappia albiluteola TaxID=2758565 RepID=A0A839AJC7_9HYPH|nr:insulinase family protein [Stappia albiluteola]